jgi:hypothetical protein
VGAGGGSTAGWAETAGGPAGAERQQRWPQLRLHPVGGVAQAPPRPPLRNPFGGGSCLVGHRFVRPCSSRPRPSACHLRHVELNPGQRATLSGALNDKAAVVAPWGLSDGDHDYGYHIVGAGSSTVVFDVSGRSYRRAVLKSTVSRSADTTVQPAQTKWEVASDLYAFACTQRGSTRNPLVDCGNGTHQFTRGSAQVPTADWDAAYTVSLPISYYARVVDIHGRPLGQPYRTSTGHWTLNANTTGGCGPSNGISPAWPRPGRQGQYSPPVYPRYSPTARSTNRGPPAWVGRSAYGYAAGRSQPGRVQRGALVAAGLVRGVICALRARRHCRHDDPGRSGPAMVDVVMG